MTQLHSETEIAKSRLTTMEPNEFQNWYSEQVDLARTLTEPLTKAVSNGKITPVQAAQIGASIFYNVLNPLSQGQNMAQEVKQHLSSLNSR